MIYDRKVMEENAGLKALLALRDQEIQRKEQQLEKQAFELKQKDNELKIRQLKIDELHARLKALHDRLYKRGNSETMNQAQLLLELDEVKSELGALQNEPPTIQVERRLPIRPRVSRAEYFKDLPVDETIVIEPEEVKAAPDLYERIGEERTFEVDVIPLRFFKREIIRPKYRLLLDRQRAPVVAAAPARLIEGGYASAGLLVWIAESKYMNHLPLYRLEKMTQRLGVRIPRQTMSEWMEILSLWLLSLYNRIRRDLIEGPYLQADETPVRYLDPEEKKGQARQGYLWVLSRPDGPVIFDWRLTRQHSHARHLLRGFEGVLQSDGYQAYQAVERSACGITRVACLAHVRRKWFESLKTHPREAHLMLKIFERIYAREKQYREESLTAHERGERRKQELSLLFKRIRQVAMICRTRALPKSRLGTAAQYTLSQWEGIQNLLNHGIAEPDNNLVENAIRPTAIGRKNWLFVGAPEAGAKGAILYSIFATCQRFGVDPHAYLRDVLTRLPRMNSREDITHLLPQNWKPQSH